MMLTIAVKVQSARDQFLAGPAFALDQNRAVSVGDFVNQAVNELHFSACADDVLKFVFVLEFLAEVNVLPQRRLIIEGALYGHLQLVDLERLGHVIVRAHLHRFDRGLHGCVRGNQNHGGLPEMLAHVPEHVEAGHCFHSNVGNDDVGLNRIHLLDCFLRGVERENLVTFFPAKGDDDFDHRRLVIDDYDLGHSQRGEYFTFEKKKEGIRKKLINCHGSTMEHEPWNFADKIENCLVNVFRSCKWQSYHICQKTLFDSTKLIFLP